MAGFSTYDSIVSRLSTDLAGQLLIAQEVGGTMVASIPYSYWALGNLPAAGGYGTLGKANGRTLTDATTGAIPFSNAAALKTLHLLNGAATLVSGVTGTLYLVDRISDVLIAHNEATGSITGLDATSRLPSGGGAQIWIEVQSALSAASNTLTFTYTNQAGTGSRTTANIVTTASAIVNRSCNSNLWQPLQAGDSGVRSIQSVTLVSGTGTGSICVSLVRPLAWWPLVGTALTTDKDFVTEMAQMPRIYDDSCLTFIYVPSGTTATTLHVNLLVADN